MRAASGKQSIWIVLFTVLLAIFAAAYFVTVPLLTRVLHLPPPILDATNHLTSEDGTAVECMYVPMDKIAPDMCAALLASEDRHFYYHHGIDLFGVLRATLTNVKAGELREGGSTISQQLAKNRFLDFRDRSAERKLKQMVLAWQLESRYSKDKILESYLNTVYFGNGAYGIEVAARRYFNVTAAKLNLAQSAFLAGLVQAPSDLGATTGKEAALKRQQEILDKLLEYGMCGEDAVNDAKKYPLVFHNGVYQTNTSGKKRK